MLKFSELLERKEKESVFILGMIYRWVMVSKDKKTILAYCSYGTGSRVKKAVPELIANMTETNKKVAETFNSYLGGNFKIIQNNEIKNKYGEFRKNIGNGVSFPFLLEEEIPENVDLDVYIFGLIEKSIIGLSQELKDEFILGLMTSASSLDFTFKLVTVDIERMESNNLVERKINFLIALMGMKFNLNTRTLQPEGEVRNHQFRIPMEYFMAQFGLINYLRIAQYKAEIPAAKYVSELPLKINKKINQNDLAKSLSRGMRINALSAEMVREETTKERKGELIKEYREEFGFDMTTDEVLHSNVNIKNLAKEKSNYMCEIDNGKESFISKANGKNYIEAHHLIPFAKRDKFNVNIDVVENIVCLTAKNHRKIHLAIDEEREEILRQLYEKKKLGLQKVGIVIDFDLLKQMYGFSN